MAVPWPSQLQSLVNTEGFSFEIGDTSIRSESEVGPAKVRRRFTKSVDMMTTTINLLPGDFSVFYYFYDTSLNGGTLPFSFVHPITGVSSEFRFTKPPSIRPLGGSNFAVTMSWEELP